MFGDERLHRSLRGMAGLPARGIVDAVAIAVTDHLGDRPHDDIALVAVQHRPVPA
jgi:serine phosphatase RsbU (regulator of sigma subunit)